MEIMDRTCVNCKFTGIMLGVPVCNHTGHCLNYDYFEPKEMIKVSRTAHENMKYALEIICKFDLKPYENEKLHGADKLKMIAYKGLQNE